MKNKQEQLISRGYLDEGVESEYLDKSFDEKIELLHSKTPTDRTLGARLLANSKNSQSDLIRWEIIRAMSGYPESEPFLQEQKQIIHYERLQKEIERSLLLI